MQAAFDETVPLLMGRLPRYLLLWLLLACSGEVPILLRAQPTPSLGPPLALTACPRPVLQYISLCLFYQSLNGRNWNTVQAWAACDDMPRPPFNTTMSNITSGTCRFTNVTVGATFAPAAGTASEPPVSDPLPDFCCWPGVACCYFELCRTSLDNPVTCNCTPGSVVALELPNNNVAGNLNGPHNSSSAYSALQSLSCSLRVLRLSNNRLSGSLPQDITKLSELWMLGLGYNQITGTIPAELRHMTSLSVLEIINNNISGPVPHDICGSEGSMNSPLTDILIASNQLTGILNLDQCTSLIMLDATENQLTGVNAAAGFYLQLHVMLMQNNHIHADNVNVDLSRARLLTELNLGSNNLSGFIPASISEQLFLTTLVLANNNFIGTISTSLFDNLGSLSALDLSNNKLTGSFPAVLGSASSLYRLDLSNNHLTGVLPDSIITFMSVNNSYLDIRSTLMSCCGYNFQRLPNGTGRYSSVNWSAPRLPKGLMLSTVLQPISEYSDPLSPNDGSNLYCPFIKVDPDYQPYSQYQDNLLVTWFLSPSYTLYEQCRCSQGSVMVNDTNLLIVYCVPVSDGRLPWGAVLAGVLGGALLLTLLLWFMFFRGTRPIIVQHIMGLRKRVKGAPQGGTVAIVVTDVEGFSNLMKTDPKGTSKALALHNSLLRKASWTSFGTTIEQEGDSFAIAFHEAQDAVKFCIQAQLLLESQAWPPGLLDAAGVYSRRKVKGLGSGNSKTKRINILKRLTLGISHNSNSPNASMDLGKRLVSKLGATSAPYLSLPPPPGESQSGSVNTGQPSPSVCVNAEASEGAVSAVRGLRVRMGIACGDVPHHSVLSSSQVMELAKTVSDAACGGQVLMCSSTFQAVRSMGRELGCVGLEGMDYAKLNSSSSIWTRCWKSGQQRPTEEATLLHMGQYLHCRPGSEAPLRLAPRHLGLELEPQAGPAAEPQDWQPHTQQERDSTHLASTSMSRSQQGMVLYQVLAPSQVARGRWFSSRLALKEQWVPLDVPYFSAPGALLAPLTPLDVVPSHLSLPLVTSAFCMVDGGKQYASRNRRDAEALHAQLLALMWSVLRQVPGGYFVKGQDGDLKYMLAFTDPRGAVSWCLAVQECALYVEWPTSALKHWPIERGEDNRLLFRGPRLKMGICEGTPRSISPDYNGRADYLGDNINQAARFMDAAAHGGQVACRMDLAAKLLASIPDSFGALASPVGWSGISLAGSQLSPGSQGPSAVIAAEHEHGPAAMASCRSAAGAGLPSSRHLATCRECDDDGGAYPSRDTDAADRQPGSEQTREEPEGQQQQHAVRQDPQPEPERQDPHLQAATGDCEVQGAALLSSITIDVKGMSPPFLQPPAGYMSDVLAMHLGSFSFKGSNEIIPMVHLTQASLSGRSFQTDPPKGKGSRQTEASGLFATAHVPLLDIIKDYACCEESNELRSITMHNDVQVMQSHREPASPYRLFSQLSLRRIGTRLRQSSRALRQTTSSGSHRLSDNGVRTEGVAPDHQQRSVLQV